MSLSFCFRRQTLLILAVHNNRGCRLPEAAAACWPQSISVLSASDAPASFLLSVPIKPILRIQCFSIRGCFLEHRKAPVPFHTPFPPLGSLPLASPPTQFLFTGQVRHYFFHEPFSGLHGSLCFYVSWGTDSTGWWQRADAQVLHPPDTQGQGPGRIYLSIPRPGTGLLYGRCSAQLLNE